MLDIEIDGKKLEVAEGSSVMEAAGQAGTFIPHFCYHKKLSIAASCRMCLVEVEKAPKPLPACATAVTNGMKVSTHSGKAVAAQKSVMEFLLINHPLDCPICDQGGECQLQDVAVGYGAGESRYKEEKRVVVNKDLGPLIATDMTRCIHCTRCVRFGQEIAGIMELGVANRGDQSEIMTFVGRTVDSELSGNSIGPVPGRRADFEALPLRRPDLGDVPPPRDRAARLAWFEPGRSGPTRPGQAGSASGKRGDQRMLALRPRSLLL